MDGQDSPKKTSISKGEENPVYLTRSQKKKICRLKKIPSDTSLHSFLEAENMLLQCVKECKKITQKKKPKLIKDIINNDEIDSKGNIKGLIDYSLEYCSSEDSDYIPTEHDTEDTLSDGSSSSSGSSGSGSGSSDSGISDGSSSDISSGISDGSSGSSSDGSISIKKKKSKKKVVFSTVTDDNRIELKTIDVDSIKDYRFRNIIMKYTALSYLGEKSNKTKRSHSPSIRIAYSAVEELYLDSLDEDSRKQILEIEKELQKLEQKPVPRRFQILQSGMDIKTKYNALERNKTLQQMDSSNGEYHKQKKWLDNLLKVPFGKYTGIPISISDGSEKVCEFIMNTNDILNKNVYGHEEAKSHIIQLITRWVTNPKSNGAVIGIQGPMGNGKTTLVKKGICKALKKPFVLIPLGGSSDASFLEGHSFTYEGSIPGRIVETLTEPTIQCMDPIFYFDELDKISDTTKGEEIHNVLCHITDFSQNDVFNDKYYSGVSFDISKALFIFSFNDERKINPILRDRMTIIRTKGFNIKDKVALTKKFLLPEIYDNIGMDHTQVIWTDEIIRYTVQQYTDEKGVRDLKRCIDSVLSQLNIFKIIKDPEKTKLFVSSVKKPVVFPITLTRDWIDKLIKKKDSRDKYIKLMMYS